MDNVRTVNIQKIKLKRNLIPNFCFNFKNLWWPWKRPGGLNWVRKVRSYLFGAGVFGDSFGSLAHGVLGQLSGQQETHRRLNFATRYGGATIVMRQLGGLIGNTVENVVHKRIHDTHRLARDTSIGMDLFQHFVDVDGVGLLSLLVAFLTVSFGATFGRFYRLGHTFGALGSYCYCRWFWWHSISTFSFNKVFSFSFKFRYN